MMVEFLLKRKFLHERLYYFSDGSHMLMIYRSRVAK